ncbi:MAG: hypothetical protein QMC98_00640, partial [Candidatus Thermoplasmatota archaeon]|nr:hypothetical protein [Candidatus Thermoplasmatota archaeon]
SHVFWNKNYDIYISYGTLPITIDASYDRRHVYFEDTTNTDEDHWNDNQELYVYGFNPYIRDDTKENANADFDNDRLTNLNEGSTYSTDPLNPDTDLDLIRDKDEMDGITTRYIVDKGAKGYLFYKEITPGYSKTFSYKTSPFNPDTDFDGQNDYNDLIPLDYDMDGDGKINYHSIAQPNSACYVERIAIAANNDPNLERVDGAFVWDDDIDDDKTSLTDDWVWDLDVDADGMPDKYEIKYGCTTETLNPDADGIMVWNQVGGNGWQHPWIHNARYAVLVAGGGDIDPSKTLLVSGKIPKRCIII